MGLKKYHNIDSISANIKERVIEVTLEQLGAIDYNDNVEEKIIAYAIANNIQKEANEIHKWVVLDVVTTTTFDYATNGVAYYKFDETNSTHALDYIGTNDGVISASEIQGFDGIINKAYRFNNSTDKVDLQAPLLPLDDSDFAISFIVKGDSSLGGIITQYSVADPNRFGIRFNNTKLSYWKGGTFLYTSDAIIANGEFHICQISRQNGVVSVYIDGELDGTFSDNTGFENLNTFVGVFDGGSQSLSNTIIDEVYFRNTFLTQEDVTNIYNSGNNAEFKTRIIVVLEKGQSPMEGRFGDTTNPDYPFTTNNGYYFDGVNKVSLTTTRGDAIGGSHANYFAEKLYELTNKKPVLLEEASGGSGLTPTSQAANNWSASGTLRASAINKANAYKAYSGQDIEIILWAQGERDAQEMDSNPAYTKAIVKVAMQDLVDWANINFPGVPFLISETGDFDPATNTQGWQDMRAVQQEIAAENSHVSIAFDNAKNFPAEGKMGDYIHYNYIGNKEMGEAFATFINDN